MSITDDIVDTGVDAKIMIAYVIAKLVVAIFLFIKSLLPIIETRVVRDK